MDHIAMIDELKRDEGLRLKVYNDSKGIPTIGIGRNLRDRGITTEEAYHLLNNDIDEVIVGLDQHFPWWTKLDEVRQRVLVNMAFNMGIHTLLGFSRTLFLMEHGEYDGAADEMMQSAWAKQVGPRAERLAAMMRTGTI